MRFELATPADDAEIRRILRENPLEGAIRLSFEREPDHALAGGVQGDHHQTIVARDEAGGPVAGIGSRSIFEAWVGGAPARIGFLSQLRVDRQHRGRLRALLSAYRYLRELHADGGVPYYLTTVVEDNRPARRLLEAGLKTMPRYQPLGRLITLLLPVRPARPPLAQQASVRQAAAGDLEDIVACLARRGARTQFAPHWTEALLRSPHRCRGLAPGDFRVALRGRRIAGCLALWDQRGFKQTVVRGYAPVVRLARLARPALGLLAPALGLPSLPCPGEALRHAFISHVAVDDDDPGVLVALVEAVRTAAARSDIDHLVACFADNDPLLGALAGTYPTRRYGSILYAVHWDDGARAVDALEARIPHPEVAIL